MPFAGGSNAALDFHKRFLIYYGDAWRSFKLYLINISVLREANCIWYEEKEKQVSSLKSGKHVVLVFEKLSPLIASFGLNA